MFKAATSIFGIGNGSVAALSEKIEQRILRDFGFFGSVFLRTAKELEEIIKDNPFLKETAIDHSKLHITFLSDAAPKRRLEALQPLAVKPEQFLHWPAKSISIAPTGMADPKLSNTAIEESYRFGATTRNWRTVNTLLAMTK